MVQINEHYQKLKAGYLFPEIARRVNEFHKKNPQASIIRLGIGDVVLPLVPAVIRAMKDAVEEMGTSSGFHGYGPERGYDFLIDAIIKNEFEPRGISLNSSEVFVSDGSKCDSGNIQEIFSSSSRIAVVDPVYPVYVDTNVMAGRTVLYLPATEANAFTPDPPKEKVDLVYLCSPNNPTGATMTKEDLEKWVDYAKKNDAVLLFDAAYESFITDPAIPHSIYEIDGAKEVAIEFRSFSKRAGFTGVRCAFTVIPEGLKGTGVDGRKVSIQSLWNRRHSTKFNGVAYPVQRGAEATYSPEGQKQISQNIRYYMENARLIRDGLQELGMKVFGGVNAPYIWLKTPDGLSSWQFFDRLLEQAHVVGTPGAGFGPSGEGYYRLSAFGMREKIEEAISRIQKNLQA